MEMFFAVLLGVVAADAPEARASTALSSERQHEPSYRIPLAVLDVAKVFKEARGFNQKMQSMKLEIADFDRNVKARRGEPTDPIPADLEDEVKAKKAAFLSDEAQVYAETYRQIENTVQKICRDRDIGIVIRFTNDSLDPNNRGSVLQAVNRPVVYTGVPDLTADVIAALNKSDASTALSVEREQTSSHRIPLAVIDTAKVFKEVRDINDKVQRLKEHLNERMKGGAPATRNEKELAEESLVYADAYREIENAVKNICRERDIGIVIRFTSDSMDLKDRSSVLQAVNRPVVYTAVPDLTADVIAALNKGSQ